MTITKRLKVLLIAVLLVVSIIFSGQATLSAISFCYAETTVYSDVLDDLEKDETFNLQDYPQIAGSYDIELIQIAESTTGELLLYVYQPGNGTLKEDVKCNYINLALDGDGLDFYRYSLTLLDTTSTFSKYKVEDFTVGSDTYRYYTISVIYRPWINEIDGNPPVGTYYDSKDFKVGCTWCVYYYNNVLTYQCKYPDFEDIDLKILGRVRYLDGFKFYTTACDSHFIAFSTDKPIESIIDAEIIYYTQDYTYSWAAGAGGKTQAVGERSKDIKKTLSKNDNVTYTPSGWFAEEPKTWERIESVEDFINNEKKQDVTLNDNISNEEFISNYHWVFRFVETDYRSDYTEAGGIYKEKYTAVEGVSILRLHFVRDGRVWNLGVVDNIAHGDSNPDGFSKGFDFDKYIEWFEKIFALCLFILIIVIVTPVLNIVITLFKVFVTGIKIIFSIILFPLKLISKKRKK